MPHVVPESIDTGLNCLVIISRFYNLPADAAQLQHQFGQSDQVFGSTEILRASKLQGLKARSITSDWSRLGRIQLPAIAQHKDGHYSSWQRLMSVMAVKRC